MHQLSHTDIATINQLLQDCGKEANQLAAESFQVFEKGIDDYVTSVDRLLDDKLLRAFRDLFPNDSIITEENLQSKLSYRQASRLWLIDPIDGTEEFMRQGASYALMVGLLVDSEPQAGWVYAPAQQQLVWGGPGWGLFDQQGAQDPRPLTACEPSEQTCRVMIGDKDRKRYGHGLQENFAQLYPQSPQMQFLSLGSFGLKVLEVVRGHVGLYLYLNGRVKLWDTVGPLAIAQAAGLVCCDLTGDPIRFDAQAIDAETLVHYQPIVVGWPAYVDWLLPVIRQTVAQMGVR